MVWFCCSDGNLKKNQTNHITEGFIIGVYLFVSSCFVSLRCRSRCSAVVVAGVAEKTWGKVSCYKDNCFNLRAALPNINKQTRFLSCPQQLNCGRSPRAAYGHVWLSTCSRAINLTSNPVCFFFTAEVAITGGLGKKGRKTRWLLSCCLCVLRTEIAETVLILSSAFSQLLPLIRKHRRCEVPLLSTACLAGDFWSFVAEKGEDGQWRGKSAAAASYSPVALGVPNTRAKDTQGFWKCCTFCHNRLPADFTDAILYRRPKFPISA